MKVENGVRLLAGIMILISVLFTLLLSPWFLVLTGFVGLNLVQSAFTGFCPAEAILKKMGARV